MHRIFVTDVQHGATTKQVLFLMLTVHICPCKTGQKLLQLSYINIYLTLLWYPELFSFRQFSFENLDL